MTIIIDRFSTDLKVMEFLSLQPSVLAMYSATFLAWIAGLKASVVLHNCLMSNIVKCPMVFFDSTPKGRILARFSHDINTLDDRLINNFRQLMNTGLRVRESFESLVVNEIKFFLIV